MVSHLSLELCFARQIGANSTVRTGGGARGHRSWLLISIVFLAPFQLLIRGEKKGPRKPGMDHAFGVQVLR